MNGTISAEVAIFNLSDYLREWLAAASKRDLKLAVDIDPQSFQ